MGDNEYSETRYAVDCCGQNRALMTDVISRVLFPALFLLFNAIYWPMYYNSA